MTTIRRIYVYLLAFASLAVLAVGCANLLQTLIDVSFQPQSTGGARQAIALSGAAAVVALPTWLAHWFWAEHRLRNESSERTSVLRRLYLYTILALSALIATGSLHDAVQRSLDAFLSVRHPLEPIAHPLPFLVTALAVWFFHLRIAARDRQLGGEIGGSATLRRWYVYGAAFIGFVMLLFGARATVEQTLRSFSSSDIGRGLADPIATIVAGLALWILHWSVLTAWSRSESSDGSTLRGVYLFLGLTVTVFGALLGVSAMLHFGVARLLGVSQSLADLLAPISYALVFGLAWLFQRSVIKPAHREQRVERLYAYLVSLISLTVYSVGLAGVLWTLVDGIANRDQLALYVTAVIVGLPVWFAHWGTRSVEAEADSLARKLYIYLTLIVAMLALLGSSAAAVYRVFSFVLAPESGLWTDLGHALAVASVAVVVAVYHWRALAPLSSSLAQFRYPPDGLRRTRGAGTS